MTVKWGGWRHLDGRERVIKNVTHIYWSRDNDNHAVANVYAKRKGGKETSRSLHLISARYLIGLYDGEAAAELIESVKYKVTEVNHEGIIL